MDDVIKSIHCQQKMVGSRQKSGTFRKCGKKMGKMYLTCSFSGGFQNFIPAHLKNNQKACTHSINTNTHTHTLLFLLSFSCLSTSSHPFSYTSTNICSCSLTPPENSVSGCLMSLCLAQRHAHLRPA